MTQTKERDAAILKAIGDFRNRLLFARMWFRREVLDRECDALFRATVRQVAPRAPFELGHIDCNVVEGYYRTHVHRRAV